MFEMTDLCLFFFRIGINRIALLSSFDLTLGLNDRRTRLAYSSCRVYPSVLHKRYKLRIMFAAIDHLLKEIEVYKNNILTYSDIWSLDKHEYMDEFKAGAPTAENYDQKIIRYVPAARRA